MKLIKKIVKNFLIPSDNAMFLCKLALRANSKKLKIISIIIKNKLIKKYGIHLGLNSKLGDNLLFPHPDGIVIGEGVVVGDNCTIYQQVTIGKKRGNLDENMDYPLIGDNVIIFAGAKIIGNIKIGSNSIIGANSVVTSDIEPFSVYAGMPAKKIKSLS